jgi:hypothetical protein
MTEKHDVHVMSSMKEHLMMTILGERGHLISKEIIQPEIFILML